MVPVPAGHGAAAVLSADRPDPLQPATAQEARAGGLSAQPAFATDPEALHPLLWRAHRLGRARAAVTPSGFAGLDAELPGGGWPHGTLTELLLPHPGLGELRLVAPALACVARAERCVMLFDPPAALSGWALAQLGVATEQLLVIYGRSGPRRSQGLRRQLPEADLLWALEQSLRSGHVGAVLAWLPLRLRADALRRLQIAAQSHDGPAFLLREIDARLKPSPAPLRLALGCAGIDTLALRVLKRRGPPLAAPLALTLPPVLTDRLRARARLRDEPVREQSPARAAHMAQ